MPGTYYITYTDSTDTRNPTIPPLDPLQYFPRTPNTFPLRFVGYRYPQYGEVMWTNFLHLLENYANDTPPGGAVIGQLWFNTSRPPGQLNSFNGTKWVELSMTTVLAAPVASFTKSAISGVTPLTVAFVDTSTNTPTSWLWTFGDDTTSTIRNPAKTYTNTGTYSVTLKVTNSTGSDTSAVQQITVAASVQSPIASFSKSATSGVTPLSVTFTDTSANAPTSWLWTFGDGTTSTVQNPTKSYTTAGMYSVTLRATNSAGNSTSAAQVITATASVIVPVASFTKSAASGTTPLSVTFTDTSTNTPTSWLWNFGDGTTSTTRNPTKSYATAGSYNVTLTATNSAGSGASAAQTITVTAAAATYNEVITWNTNPPTAGSQNTTATITGGKPNTTFAVSWTGTPAGGVPVSGSGTLNSSGAWSLAAGNHFKVAGTYTGTYVFTGSGNTKTVSFTTKTYNEIATVPATAIAGTTSFTLAITGGAPGSVVTGTSTKGNWTTTRPWQIATTLPVTLGSDGTGSWTGGLSIEESGYYKGTLLFDTGHVRTVTACVTPKTIIDSNGTWANGAILSMSNGTFYQGSQLISAANATVTTINGWYITYVNRQADQGGMIYWLAQVAASSLAAVLPDFIADVELSKTTPGGQLYGRTFTGAVDFCSHVAAGKAAYVLTAPSYTIVEGNTIQVWVSTTNVPQGTVLTWQVWGGDTGIADITPLTGSLTVGPDYGEFINFVVNKDSVPEAKKYFGVELFRNGVGIASSLSFMMAANST